MHISYYPAVQACDDFPNFDAHLKGEQINFKFLLIQFRLVRKNWVKHSYDNRFKNFSQLIYNVGLSGTITFIYNLDQACTDNALKNYLHNSLSLIF